MFFGSMVPGDWEHYRLERTLSLRRGDILSCFWSRARSAKGDSKQFWNTMHIKPFFHCKQSSNEGTSNLKENGILETDKKEEAEILNNYFFLIQNVS